MQQSQKVTCTSSSYLMALLHRQMVSIVYKIFTCYYLRGEVRGMLISVHHWERKGACATTEKVHLILLICVLETLSLHGTT